MNLGVFSRWAALCLLLLSLPGQTLTRETPAGLEAVECWFEAADRLPPIDCYRMHVPENHDLPDGKTISFPVIVVKARFNFWSKPPVLHLGGGGPGGPLYLDDPGSVSYIWEYHDQISTDQRRDLILMDPRGVGLADPVLSCHTFIENVGERLTRNLSLLEDWRAADRDFKDCIDDYARQGIDFGAYNSYSISRDIEMLRRAMDVERWVLIGVSYATIYAQMLAREFPESIEAMILDSATFPNLPQAETYLRLVEEPFRAMLGYCRLDADCSQPLPDFETRFWNLHRELNRNPLPIVLTHPYRDRKIELVLNGERFLGALLWGTYSMEIYRDLPAIVTELEQRRGWSIRPYLDSMLLFTFDDTWGDVSAEAHYCFDIKPWTDFERIRSEASRMPPGYLRDVILMGLNWGDNCDRMGIGSGYAAMARAQAIDVPTLFLHGEFDTVTFLDDVVAQQRHFNRSHLVKYPLAHSMITSDECAEVVAAKFIDDPEIEPGDLNCD